MVFNIYIYIAIKKILFSIIFKEFPSKDEIIGLASIAVPPSDPLEHYLLDHENDMFMNERREIDEVFFK